MITMTNRVHIYAHPETKERLIEFFTSILDCEPIATSSTSILAFRFTNNASLSIELTEDALDEQQASLGAWLEVKTEDPTALTEKVLAAGLHQVKYPLTGRFYFQAPGGQIWGIAGL